MLEDIAFGQPRDQIGYSVAIDGETAVVGAPYAYRDHTTEIGAAYVFTRTPDGSWTSTRELIAPDGGPGDEFGYQVAVDGDLAAVSALASDNTSLLQGIVYLFERNADGPDNWGLIKTVIAPDAAYEDQFGVSLALQDDLLVVGSLNADHSSHPDAGAVYIFERDRGAPGNWGLAKKIVADDSRDWAHFGRTVALDGDILVANADIADDLGTSTTYIFKRDYGGPDNWGQVQKFTGSSAKLGEHYGWSAALSGELLTIGAYWATVGDNEKQGALYVFRAKDEARTEWTEVAILTAPDGQPKEEFSRALTISDNLLVVGAPYAQVGDNLHQGAAYVFLPHNSDFAGWDMTMKIVADAVDNGGQFAFSLASSGDLLVLGWPSVIPEGTARGAAYFYRTIFGGAQ